MANLSEVFETAQVVEVHAMGRWYRGQVLKVGTRRVTCEYTSGAGVTRVKSCAPDKVRTLDGVQVTVEAAPAIAAGANKGAAKRMFNNRVDWVGRRVREIAAAGAITTFNHGGWYKDPAKTEAQIIAEREEQMNRSVGDAVAHLVHLAHEAGILERE